MFRANRFSRYLTLAVLVAILVAAMAGAYYFNRLRSSLPVLEGELSAGFVSAPVQIERDELGTVTLTGSTRTDLAAALGFCHGQERFFAMDLMRRSAAGELSGLVGSAAIPEDRKSRIHRFRARARQHLEGLDQDDLELLNSYTAGVNAGLAALDEYPFEYLLLDQDPIGWLPEDSLLVVYAMYLDLQGANPRMEAAHGLMRDLLPPEVYDFLAPPGTEWDAPVEGEAFATPEIPGPEIFNLRDDGASVARRERRSPDLQMLQVRSSDLCRAAASGFPNPPQPSEYFPLQAGSNNWAVSGSHTSHGQPIVADDMHLGLRVPNIWFRASMVLDRPSGEQRRVTGVSLPGTPLIVAGSNGRIAWGFTNSQGDWLDLVILEPGPKEGTYLTPDGPRPLELVEERIVASDGTEEVMEIEGTVWGPVVKTDHLGRRLAARWVAYDSEGVNLNLAGLEDAGTVEEAFEIAASTGIPAQNFTVADRDGNIGWTICGPIPRRIGYDGKTPRSWASGECSWDGYLEPGEYPKIVNPPGGRIWTANARVVSGEKLEKVGFGGYVLGPRAKQIRDDLMVLDLATEENLLGVQLDHRAIFLSRWRDLLLEEVPAGEDSNGDEDFREARKLLENWGGKAAPDSAGYRIVRRFRNILAEEVFDAVTAACREADEQFSYGLIRREEGPLWKLVTGHPLHWLPPEYGSWQELMAQCLEQVILEAREDPVTEDGGLSAWTWGERNTAAIRHPLSPFLPSFFSRYLDASADQLPGDSRMPRDQGPGFGASERMVVSPGLEEQGILQMPGGQSGHPLSPFYLSGHDDWVEGTPTPFLPGETEYELVLRP